MHFAKTWLSHKRWLVLSMTADVLVLGLALLGCREHRQRINAPLRYPVPGTGGPGCFCRVVAGTGETKTVLDGKGTPSALD